MNRFTLHIAVIALLGSIPAGALAQIEVKNAWVRGTVPAQTSSAAYMEITSNSGAKLVGAASPAAGKVEVHNMKMENGVMKMFPVDGIELPAGKPVKLAPGGYHVMLLNLKQQLKVGDKVPVSLTVEDADKKRQTTQVTAEVRDLTSAAQSGGAGHHKN
jgi:copper(I)-binding protein